MSTLDPSIDESHRIDYLFECMRTTREEMLFRIKHRDNWLSAHLVVQAGLLALAQGVEMAGLKGPKAYPDVLVLALPIAFILACLYFVEDLLISNLCRYSGSLSQAEAALRNSAVEIANPDTIRNLRRDGWNITPLRALAQVVGFMLVPGGLALLHLAQLPQWNVLGGTELVLDAILWLGIALLIWRCYLSRWFIEE